MIKMCWYYFDILYYTILWNIQSYWGSTFRYRKSLTSTLGRSFLCFISVLSSL